MKNRFNFNVIGIIGLLIFAVSCESNKFEDQQMTHVANSMLLTQILANQPCTPTATSPSFASLSPYITDSANGCARTNCHSGPSPQGSLDMTNYSQVVARVVKGQPLQSLLYNRLDPQTGNMFKYSNTAFNQLVFDWIQGCALP
jgi:hypothetical protein